MYQFVLLIIISNVFISPAFSTTLNIRSIGAVMEIKGSAIRINQSGNNYKNLKVGMSVSVGDTISSGPISYLKILIEKNTIIHLGANTVFTIDNLTTEKDQYRLVQGELRANFLKDKTKIHEITTNLVFVDLWDAEILISSNDSNVELLTVAGLARLHIENQKNIPLRAREYMSTTLQQLDLHRGVEHEYTLYEKRAVTTDEFNNYRFGASETGRFIRLAESRNKSSEKNKENYPTSKKVLTSTVFLSSDDIPKQVSITKLLKNTKQELYFIEKMRKIP